MLMANGKELMGMLGLAYKAMSYHLLFYHFDALCRLFARSSDMMD